MVRNSWNSFKSMASVFVLETDTPHPNRGENRFVAKPPLADFITCHEMLRCMLVGKLPYRAPKSIFSKINLVYDIVFCV